MNLISVLKLSIEALLGKKTRTILTILMVVIGSSLIVGLNGLGAGFEVFIEDQFSTLSPNTLIITPASSFQRGEEDLSSRVVRLDSQVLKNLENIDGIKEIFPIIYGSAKVTSNGLSKNIAVIGIDQTKLNSALPSFTLESGKLVYPNDSIGVLVGQNVKNPVGSNTYFVDVDERVVLEYNSYASGKSDVKKRSFLVRGVANELGTSSYLNIDDGITISLSSANSLFDKKGKYDMIYIVTEDIDLNSAIEEDIREIYGKDIGISSPQVIVETVKGFISGFTSFILAIGAISLIVAGVGIVTTLITAVLERTKEIGLLKAIGFKSRNILLMFLCEAILIGVIGGFIGILGGIGLGMILPTLLAASFGGGEGGFVLSAVFNISSILNVWILVILLSAFAGLYPAWRASKLDPVVALRKE